MSKPVVVYWPSALTIANPSQALVPQNSNIPLIGGVFEYKDMIRSIDIVSADALPGVSYRVTGIGCTVDVTTVPNVVIPTSVLGTITEDINAAGAGNLSPSVNIYKKITSIEVLGGDATNVEISYGEFGITDYINGDFNRSTPPLNAASLQIVSHVTLYASAWFSLNNPEHATINGNLEPFGYVNGTNVYPAGQFIPQFPIIPVTQVDAIGSMGPFPFAVAWASVKSCTFDSVFFTIIQPGIT